MVAACRKSIARTWLSQVSGVKLKSHAEFVKDLKSQRDDVIITGRYAKALEKTKFRFSKCGHECDITPAHVLSGRGCPECGRSQKGASQRLTMEIFLERLHKIDPNLVASAQSASASRSESAGTGFVFPNHGMESRMTAAL